MPILVECPSCRAKLNAPDSAAGKKVRCPKAECGTLVPVPEPLEAEEVAVVDAAIAPLPPPKPVRAAVVDDDRPRKRRRDRDEDDDDRPRSRRGRDDDDDDDDRPRRRRGAERGRSGANTGKVVAFVVGGLLLLGGIGAGGYFLFFSKSSPLAGGNSSPPSGWKEYTYADAGFKAYFPNEPRRVMDDSPGRLDEAGGRGLMLEYTAHSVENESALTAVVYTRRIPPHITPEKAREIIYKEFENPARFPIVGLRLIESRSVTWLGHKVKEFQLGMPEDARRSKDAVIVQRCVVTDTHEIHAQISAEDGRKLTSRTINGFFDNIQPLQ
jgi:hypothetical protein